MSMIPSGTESLNDEFDGTYADLQKKLANTVADVDKTMDEHSEQVRQDHALVTLIGQLRSRATWTLDRPGMLSAGRQGFVLSVYKELLPTLYARYDVSNCSPKLGPLGGGTICYGPEQGSEGVLGSPPSDFTAILARPTANGPCHVVPAVRNRRECDFTGTVSSELAGRIWEPQQESCAYDGTAKHEWTPECSLGVDPQLSVAAARLGMREQWDFESYTGTPWMSTSATVSGSAGAAGVRLTGTSFVPRRVRLARARVTHNRVLFEPGGARELVRRRGGRKLAPTALTRRRGGDRLRRAYAGRRRGGPTTRLRLWHTSNRRLGFDLRLGGVKVTPPAACHQALAAPGVPPRPARLHTRLRIDDGHGRPLTLSLRPQWECRRNRLGAVRRLVVRKPPRPEPKRGGLAVTVRGPRRAAPGAVRRYRITVRNRRRTAAHDLLVRATLSRGLTALRSGGQVVRWRYARLAPGRSKTVIVRARIAPSAAGVKRLTAVAQAINARPVRSRYTTTVASHHARTARSGWWHHRRTGATDMARALAAGDASCIKTSERWHEQGPPQLRRG